MKLTHRYETWIKWDDLFEVTVRLEQDDPMRPKFKERLKNRGGSTVFGIHIRNDDIDRFRDAATSAGLQVEHDDDGDDDGEFIIPSEDDE